MIVRNNIPVYSICWLNHANGGFIDTFYEPESLEELVELCRSLYKEGKKFELIGHTSNIYFLPSYNVEFMVSTRKCNNYFVNKDMIVCDCGVSVQKLAKQMVAIGVKGFEGLIDLPGTVGGAVYGNASCFNCSINKQLVSLDVLLPNGEIVTMSKKDLRLSTRSSALKRGEINGIILAIRLVKEFASSTDLTIIANINHQIRKACQPGPKDNIGSIYKDGYKWTAWGSLIRFIVYCYGQILKMICMNKLEIKDRKKSFFLRLLGAKELFPYIYDWNRYIWKDKKAHDLFWKFHRLHKMLFKHSEFEIEIKQ